MATDMGKLQKSKNIIWSINLRKRCIKRNLKGIHNRFLRDSDVRKYMLDHDGDEDVCLKWDDLAEQDFTYPMTESEYFSSTKLVDLSTGQPVVYKSLRKTSDERLSRIFLFSILLQIDRFTADGGLL